MDSPESPAKIKLIKRMSLILKQAEDNKPLYRFPKPGMTDIKLDFREKPVVFPPEISSCLEPVDEQFGLLTDAREHQ